MEYSRNALIGIAIAQACCLIVQGGLILLLRDGPHTYSVTDVRGRTVDVPTDVDSVACIAAGTVRLMAYMDATDMVVGVDREESPPTPDRTTYYYATYRIAHEELQGITVIDQGDPKGIMDTGADVIIWSSEDVAKLDDLQRKTGIPVVAVNANGQVSVTDKAFGDNIRLLGKVLHREDRAGELLSGIDAMCSELRGYAAEVTPGKAYIGGMFYFKEGGLLTTTGKYLPFALGGAANVMPDRDGIPYTTEIKTVAGSGQEYFFVDNVVLDESEKTFDGYDILDELPQVMDNSESDRRMFCLPAWKNYGTNWDCELAIAYYIGSVMHGDVYDYDVAGKIDGVFELFFPDRGMTMDKVTAKMNGTGFSWLDW